MSREVSKSSYATLGDAANVLVLTAALLYASCVVYFTQPGKNQDHAFLDKSWIADGFCVHNKDVPYWSSFDTCLYVDVLCSLALAALYWSWRKIPEMETASEIVPMVIFSTIGHGLAHGGMAAELRLEDDAMTSSAGDAGEKKHSMWMLFAGYAVFWFPVLKASMTKVPNSIVATIAGITYLPLAFEALRKEHTFAYVQTIITVCFHIRQLALDRASKERYEYLMLTLIAAIPPVAISWNEALFCESYFRAIGGHVWYDAGIIIPFAIYYLECYRYHVLSKKDHEKVKKL